MDTDRAADDLRAIRHVMERTRASAGRHGGWFGVLWGAIWVVGFLCSQYLPGETAGWIWAVLDTTGGVATALIGARVARSGVSSPVWRPILLFFLALIAFDGLLVWLLEISSPRDVALLITLTVALTFVQAGLFTNAGMSLIGLLVAALAVGATLLVPDYFFLAMAVLGGGLLFASGFYLLRSGEESGRA
jgi:hypothetical protein